MEEFLGEEFSEVEWVWNEDIGVVGVGGCGGNVGGIDE